MLDAQHDHLARRLAHPVQHSGGPSPSRPDPGQVATQRFADSKRPPGQGGRQEVDDGAGDRLRKLLGRRAAGRRREDELVLLSLGSAHRRRRRMASTPRTTSPRAYAASASRMSARAAGSLRTDSVSSSSARSSGLIRTAASRPLRVIRHARAGARRGRRPPTGGRGPFAAIRSTWPQLWLAVGLRVKRPTRFVTRFVDDGELAAFFVGGRLSCCPTAGPNRRACCSRRSRSAGALRRFIAHAGPPAGLRALGKEPSDCENGRASAAPRSAAACRPVRCRRRR
jgi:hypothetical protein